MTFTLIGFPFVAYRRGMENMKASGEIRVYSPPYGRDRSNLHSNPCRPGFLPKFSSECAYKNSTLTSDVHRACLLYVGEVPPCWFGANLRLHLNLILGCWCISSRLNIGLLDLKLMPESTVILNDSIICSR